MKLTDHTLGEQLHISPRDIARRKELFGLTPEDELLLGQTGPQVSPLLTEIVQEFYADQVSKPEIERLIGDADTLARLHQHMERYLHALFGGVYDELYVQSRLRVGMVHNRIGVSPKLYVSSVRTLLNILRRRLTGEALGGQCGLCQPLLASLEKILSFDLSLVFDTYIHALVSQVERGKRELEEYAEGLEEEVAQRTRQLTELALTDPLTGLANRRAMLDSLRHELAAATRQSQPLVLLCLDLDGFKAVNDTHGHDAGDRVLVQAAQALRQTLRASDIAVRMGGDEFAAILPGATLELAREVVLRLFAAFDALRGEYKVTMSVGLAGLDLDQPQSPEALLRQADAASYRAKKLPGNAVELG
jgi:diguanylate cyclase (GGDEF)-like protein